MYNGPAKEGLETMGEHGENDSARKEFEAEAETAGRRRAGPLGEFAYFLRRSRKWWMTPIIAMLLLVGILLVMTTTAIGPLIYALF
jgi:hypothetical protein